jgi:hypothetical protein
MARKVGQIVRRGARTWFLRVYNGRDPETKKRKYLNQTVYGGLRDAQTHLNKMLGERDRGRNLDSSKADPEPVPGSVAGALRQTAAAREELSRLRRPAASIRPAGTWRESAQDPRRAQPAASDSGAATPWGSGEKSRLS